MSEHRWSKFWWADWMRDPSLRSCSVAARGLWMDMLAIAFDGAPRGYITIGGRPATPRQLATIAGITEKQCAGLLAELEEAGVFSRDSDGRMFSRRMVRDTEASEAGREAIAKRWGKREDPISPPNRGVGSPPHSLEAEADTETEADKKGESAPRSAAPPPRPSNGVRLPADWTPDEPGYDGATAQTLARFGDYWRAQPGAKGRKTDWQATWRNWCRRDAEQRTARPAKTSTLSTYDQNAELLRLARTDGTTPLRMIG
jgi:hypothetical protein